MPIQASPKSKTMAKSEKSASSPNYFPFLTLAIFTFFMLTLPLVSYYVIASYVPDSTVYAAMGAIVTVQIIVGGYIYIAWKEESRDFDANKKNK